VPRTDPKFIRNAPNYGTGPDSGPVEHQYTIDALAKFLGFVAPGNQKTTESFVAAFGAEELIAARGRQSRRVGKGSYSDGHCQTNSARSMVRSGVQGIQL